MFYIHVYHELPQEYIILLNSNKSQAFPDHYHNK